jgi:hypothetical protein
MAEALQAIGVGFGVFMAGAVLGLVGGGVLERCAWRRWLDREREGTKR